MVNNNLKVLELFAGIGACSKALERLGIEHEIVDAVEIDKYAITSFNAIHGTNFDVQDITKWDKDIDVDLIMHGSPCFLSGEYINTTDGFINIEDINVGDMVKSHDGSYNKVISVMHNKNNCIYDIKCSACHNINTTFNHPYYVLRDGKYEWVTASELTTRDYLCIPINKNEDDVQWNGTTFCYNGYTKLVNGLPMKDLRFWYLIGRFIGDGWVCRRVDRNNNISGIKICCAKSELIDLKNKLGDVLNYCIVEDKTTYKLQFSNKELGEFCAQFGIGAKNKQIPPKILNIKTQYLEYLLKGIVDSDGCYTQGKYKVTTISKSLVYNLGELVLKVKHIPYHIYKVNRPKTYVIENRVVNQNDTYQITWSENYSKKINYVDDNYLYTRIRKINNRVELCDVYNIEVENTHSYCVMNIATHNCQDFSVAGKQAGGDVGSGTRSSLMYETIRIVGKLRPKYVVWENVKNLLSKKHKHNFDAYIETMNILGYNSYYQVLNAKDYGIPQNRERVFTISIRKDIDNTVFKFPKSISDGDINKVFDIPKEVLNDNERQRRVYSVDGISPAILNRTDSPKIINFTFPEKEPLKLRLKDMLEEQVDEKYYLSDKAIQGLKKQEELKHKPNYIENKEIVNTIDTKVGDGTHFSPYLRENAEPKILEEPQLITHNIQQTVKVRKYPVNIEKLKKVLRNAKLEQDLNNRQIAEIIDIPQTQVEHYFRTDSSFAIPSPEIWLKLKEILRIETNEFDESIMTFEEKEGVYEKANRVYDEHGLAPTLTQQEEKILVKNATKKGYDEAIDGDSINLSYPESTTRLGRVGHGVAQTLQCNDSMGVVLNPLKDKSPYGWHFEQNVYDVNGIIRSIKAGGGSGNIPKAILDEPAIQVLGNYMPSNHEASRIVDSDGLATTVKENHGTVTAILEDKMALKTKNKRIKQLVENTKFNENDTLFMDIYNQKTIVEEAGTLKAGMDHQQGNIIYNHLRIRKLTPKECWRLMGFDDSDFEKARNALNEKFYKGKDKSSSQLYKQAGNSICVPVLEKIFINLLQLDGDKYHLKEKYNIQKKNLFSFDI